jgi:uncharacterized membrane protein
MKTLLKVGLAAVALLASISASAMRAANNTTTLYAVTNLGPGGAFKASNPDANGEFLVVGATRDSNNISRPTVWTVSTDGAVVDVFVYSTLAGNAIDVNDQGMVIGSSNSGNFVDVPGVGVRFVPGAGQVLGVNNHGVVVGSTGDPSGPDGVSGAVWYVDATTGGITGPVLTSIDARETFIPRDINDEGAMAGFVLSVGSSGNTSVSAAVAEFDGNGELEVTNLGELHPRGTGSSAWSINSDGVVAGFASQKDSPSSVFLWNPAQPHELTSLGQAFYAPDINDNGQVVSAADNTANVAVGVVSLNGNLTDLNTLLVAPLNDTVESAAGINNTGHIVGLLQSGNAYVLTPQ